MLSHVKMFGSTLHLRVCLNIKMELLSVTMLQFTWSLVEMFYNWKRMYQEKKFFLNQYTFQLLFWGTGSPVLWELEWPEFVSESN